MSTLKYFQTAKFQRSYDRYNGERARIRQKIRDLNAKFQSDPASWLRNVERLRDPFLEIYRIKISEGDRLIFSVESEQIIFLDVGPHEIMEEFLALSGPEKYQVVSNVSTLPDWYFASSEMAIDRELTSLLTDVGNDEMRWFFEDELSESWIHYLDDEQFEIRSEVFERIRVPGQFEFHLLLGGAGTGKTVILLNIALSLREFGRNVVTRFSEPVLKYLNSGPQRVPGSQLTIQPGSVVLMDDPESLNELRDVVRECKSVGARALVVALDPFQWLERRVYEKFYDLIDSLEPHVHKLSLCYRQSFFVGTKALMFTSQILDKTNPFILDSKIENYRKSLNPLKEICVDKVTFIDEGGRFRIYTENLNESFKSEIMRFRDRIDLWKHWHPLLIVDDSDGFELPKEWKNLTKHLNVKTIGVDSSPSVRGCEYQEVFLLLSTKTWKLITEGVLGATSSDWQKAISFHTLMTRPKDSLVIFVK